MVGGMTPSRIVMQRERRLDRAGRRQRVADHRLVRRDRDRAHALAEHGRQRQMLHLVVFRRRGAVRVDVVDLVFAQAGIGKCGADRGDRRRAVRLGAGAVEVVGLFAAAAQDAENGRAARDRASSDSSTSAAAAFGEDEAVAILARTASRPFPARRCGSKAPKAARSGSAPRRSPNRRRRSTAPGRIRRGGSPRRRAGSRWRRKRRRSTA